MFDVFVWVFDLCLTLIVLLVAVWWFGLGCVDGYLIWITIWCLWVFVFGCFVVFGWVVFICDCSAVGWLLVGVAMLDCLIWMLGSLF